MKRLCVFCGSAYGAHPAYLRAARQLAGTLVRENIGLVFGGANVGLMGELAKAVLHAGGEVVGVIPRRLVEKELAFAELADLRIVDSMHERTDYYSGLLGFLDHTVEQGFVEREHRAMIVVEHDPDELIRRFRSYRAPRIDKARWAIQITRRLS